MTTKPKAIELADELRGETAQAKCNVVMLPRSLVEDIDAELRRLSALEQQGEAVELDHIACIDGGELRYMSGRKAPAYDCELYAMPDGKHAPALYTHPAADLTDEQIRDVFKDVDVMRKTEGKTALFEMLNGSVLCGDYLDAITEASRAIIAKVKGV